MIDIRPERHGDEEAIGDLTTRAFAGAPHAGGNEAAIVERLRNDGDLALSLIAEEGGEIVGHIAFSPVAIGQETIDWYGLGPVSVDPDRQRSGIGGALIRNGLARLRDRDVKGCVVLGDPAYYGRFGFVSDGRLTFGDAPPAYLQWLSFEGDSPRGEIVYRPGFGV